MDEGCADALSDDPWWPLKSHICNENQPSLQTSLLLFSDSLAAVLDSAICAAISFMASHLPSFALMLLRPQNSTGLILSILAPEFKRTEVLINKNVSLLVVLTLVLKQGDP